MSLIKKYQSLTPTQQTSFIAVKNMDELEALLTSQKLVMTDAEKESFMEYIQSGKLPLDDDDMEQVAGGAGKQEEHIMRGKAYEDGRTIPVASSNRTPNICCTDPRGNNRIPTLYAARYGENNPDYFSYIDVKCYKCNKLYPEWRLYFA